VRERQRQRRILLAPPERHFVQLTHGLLLPGYLIISDFLFCRACSVGTFFHKAGGSSKRLNLIRVLSNGDISLHHLSAGTVLAHQKMYITDFVILFLSRATKTSSALQSDTVSVCKVLVKNKTARRQSVRRRGSGLAAACDSCLR